MVRGFIYLVNGRGLEPHWVLEVFEAAKKLIKNICTFIYKLPNST